MLLLYSTKLSAMTPHGKFILCVDDDSDDLFFLEEAIHSVNPSTPIVQFQNGEDALVYLLKAKQEHDLPCVVVLDINMPRMDGREMLRQIKADESLSHVQIVILTTSSGKADKEFFARYDTVMFTKPVSRDGLKKIAEIFMAHCQ